MEGGPDRNQIYGAWSQGRLLRTCDRELARRGRFGQDNLTQAGVRANDPVKK